MVKKGNIPWNKGKKGLQVAWNKGLNKKNHPNLKGGGWNKGLPKEQQPGFGTTRSELSNLKNRLKHLGKKQSKESIEKRRKTTKELYKNHPERTPNWQGGKSFEPYGIEFNKELKEYIRKKYNYRCQQCFRHQDELFETWKNDKIIKRKLSIHHIDFNKNNNNENNLIPLCQNCHIQTNYNREDWINYFNMRVI